MPRITEDQEVLHESDLWLYPNHLTDAEGFPPMGEWKMK
jgi:hypothetical protein